MLKIYIAGYDVFDPNAVNIGNTLKNICAAYGFEGLFPLDNELEVQVQEIGRASCWVRV